jgi:hypothetical protein
MFTKDFIKRIEALRVGRGELARALGLKPYYLSAILTQERLDEEEARRMFAVAKKLFDERMAIFNN